MAMQAEMDRGSEFRQGLLYGDVFCKQGKIILQMNEAIDVVNTHKNKEWIKLRPFPDMDHQHLMAIHNCFEEVAHNSKFCANRPPHIKDNLLKVNELILLYETTYQPSKIFHIDVLFNNPVSYHFKEEDFELFTPESKDGYLYLDYGVTGVPVMNAFLEDVKQEPVPQYNFKPGTKIYFHKDKIWGEKKMGELSDWLSSRWNLDVNDPKLAIGFIPLGEPLFEFDRDQFAEMINEHPILDRIEFLNGETFEPVTIEVDHDQLPVFDMKTFELKNIGRQLRKLGSFALNKSVVR